MKKKRNDGYERLGLAVIKQASYDYMRLRGAIEMTTDEKLKKDYRARLKMLETRFFLTAWFELLSGGVRGDGVIEQLDNKFTRWLANDELYKIRDMKLDDASRTLHAMI